MSDKPVSILIEPKVFYSRLVWTLYLLGHRYASVLNGGIHAWLEEEYPVTKHETVKCKTNSVKFDIDDSVLASREYILRQLETSEISILEARSEEEYRGSLVLARRSGHIPGAVNLNSLDPIDQSCQYRLKLDNKLNTMLSERGIAPDQEIVVYCQTHHRSAHSWMMLRHLGFSRVRGYAGSWSGWGND